MIAGIKERLSKVDMDTGWSQEDERQCALCQKYGDSKSNVSISNCKVLEQANKIHICTIAF